MSTVNTLNNINKVLKKVKNNKLNKLSNFELFLKLGNYNQSTKTTRIVNVDEFTGEYTCLQLGNGGSWCRRSATGKYKLATMKNNGTISYLWDVEPDEQHSIENEMKSQCVYQSFGYYIKYLKICGLKENNNARPIRSDIKRHYKNLPCCACGRTTELICDHKNDLYNDPKVLNIKTQTLDDFQSLCNSCNLLKRQISKWTVQNKKRYGATNIPSLAVFGIDFSEGDEKYDPQDIKAMVGTYWFDPVMFMTKIKDLLKK
jgi:hypothetical protein